MIWQPNTPTTPGKHLLHILQLQYYVLVISFLLSFKHCMLSLIAFVSEFVTKKLRKVSHKVWVKNVHKVFSIGNCCKFSKVADFWRVALV